MQRSCLLGLPKGLGASSKNVSRSRGIHDIAISRTGKPIIRKQGGRSSLGGHTVTVFGATGFLGRYIVSRLATKGCQVVIPYREEVSKRHLKVTGDLGRVTFMEYDLRNTSSIEESVRHSDIVFNLVGRQYETKNFSYEDVHCEGTQRIAEAVAKYDVDRFIHVSSFNADMNSPSKYYRTKARGEQIVRQIFPETTIVRPAPMFGFEDKLLHRLAGATNIFTANWMQERFNPVHVVDVGKGLEVMAYDDSTAGQTYELYGPNNYSLKEVYEMVQREILKERKHINLPGGLMKFGANILNKFIWWPTMDPDEVVREFIDQKVDPSAKTFADLGITPDDINRLVIQYVRSYRSSAYYDLPPMTPKEMKEEKKYIHVEQDL